MTFDTDAITLSLRNAQTGKALTANVYEVTFNDGATRTMSIAQLVMAICLERATEMEADVVDIMEQMARVTANIEAISDIEKRLLELGDGDSLSTIEGQWSIAYEDENGNVVEGTFTNAQAVLNMLGIAAAPSMTSDAIIDNIESKLDELNTTSQEQMITLQSQTNKRDQSYELISNVVKSLYTVMTGISNNV
ncbi:MAG: hypothetical protein MJ240_01900 [Kiritimatiellae bacterium]|nr:hypothetical protein [Kiritimatiellia bacterium]